MRLTTAVAIAAILSCASPALAQVTVVPPSEARKTDGPTPMTFVESMDHTIEATGVIAQTTPATFAAFAKTHKLEGRLMALDSPGGSVIAGIALGRQNRALKMSTTVRAGSNCDSMCPFLMLSGVARTVRGRLRVHQIWLADRVGDPWHAAYTAIDLAAVQADIGLIAQYVADMGGTSALLGIALETPQWESMHELTRSELKRTRILSP